MNRGMIVPVKAQEPEWLVELGKGNLELFKPQRQSAWRRWQQNREHAELMKSIGKHTLDWARTRIEAEETGAHVNETFHFIGLYDNMSGVREKTGATWQMLRAWRNIAPPVIAIVGRRQEQTTSYAQVADVGSGFVEEPGFRIRMTKKDSEASGKNREEMAELEQFLLEAGWCAPPIDERPDNWQPGLSHFISQFIDDSLTLDWTAVQFWASKDKTFGKDWPIVSFCCVDAARHFKIRRPMRGLQNGVMRTDDWEGERKNAKDDIAYVRVADRNSGLIEAEFTANELVCYVRNGRTDTFANGYGMSELERSLSLVGGWVNGFNYNLTRFEKDSLPRGILSLIGNVNEQQLQAFRLEWQQMMRGVAKRWGVPIIRGAGDGANIAWIDIDKSSRDMEYHQMMFLMAVALHANYGIHPEETGYEALSPSRPPLSEASPESKLKYSQDWGLRPLLKHLANFINRYIVWRIYPDRRYTFEFLGVGEYLEQQQIEIWAAELNSGLNTPRNIWRRRDMTIPDPIKDHPAWDLPMPLPQGMQYVDGLAAAAQQQQMAQQQAQMQAQQTMIQGAGGMAPGGPQGAPGSEPPSESPMPAGAMVSKGVHVKRRSRRIMIYRSRRG